jgi:hypothetical protein
VDGIIMVRYPPTTLTPAAPHAPLRAAVRGQDEPEPRRHLRAHGGHGAHGGRVSQPHDVLLHVVRDRAVSHGVGAAALPDRARARHVHHHLGRAGHGPRRVQQLRVARGRARAPRLVRVRRHPRLRHLHRVVVPAPRADAAPEHVLCHE